MIEGLELGANLMFVVGSGCFLPAYAHDMDVFLMGCGLFVFGSFVYCCITFYTLCEVPVLCIVGIRYPFHIFFLNPGSVKLIEAILVESIQDGVDIAGVPISLRRCTIMTTF